MNWAILIEILIAVGFFELLREGARRFWNRKRATIDAAAVIQGMSLKLLEPLHAELEDANRQTIELRGRLRELQGDFDQVIRWSHRALDQLEQHGLTVEPIPPALRRIH